MFVLDPATQRPTFFYPQSTLNPWVGPCEGSRALLGFTFPANTHPEKVGITLCPYYFVVPSLQSLGEPIALKDQGANLAMINKYSDTGGATLLHEFTHLVSGNGTSLRGSPQFFWTSG